MMARGPYRHHVLPCAGPRCGAEVGAHFKQRLKDLCPDRKELGVRFSFTSCQGMCAQGPNITVYPDGVAYHAVCEEDLERIVEEHLRGGVPVKEIMERGGDGENSTEADGDSETI